MKITKEIKTAILALVSISLFIWGYSFLKGKDLLSHYKTYYVVYDNVEGLAASAPVTINGLIVGKVQRITLNNSTGKLVVEIQVEGNFPISKSSIIAIYEPGLIGGKQIQIIPNYEDIISAVSGDTLQGAVKKGLTDLVGEQLTPLQEKIEKMVVNADLLLINLNQLLDNPTKNALKSSVANLNETLISINSTSKNMDELLSENKDKITGTLTNISKVSSDFAVISDSLSKANLGQTIKQLEKISQNMNLLIADLQAGKGTMGKLMKDEVLYSNLNKTSKELELLLEDVRLNPTRYINVSLFGKKNKAYFMPKKDTIK